MAYKKYRVYCVTEGKYVETAGYQASPPLTCPNNNAHSIDSNKTAELDQVGLDEVKITDADKEFTNSNAGSCTFQIDTSKEPDSNGWINGDPISFDYNVTLHSVRIFPPKGSEGDHLQVQVAPDTVIGVIKEAMPSGQNYFKSDTAPIYAQDGYFMKLFNPPSTVHNCGHVMGKGVQGDKVYIQTPPNVQFPSGSIVQMTVKPIRSFQLPSGQIPYGDDLVGGMNLPSGTQMIGLYKKQEGSNVTGELRSVVQFRY